MRHRRSTRGWDREKEETRQKFAIMSMEEGAGGCSVEERVFFWVVEEWEGVRAHFCQFKQRHLSEGASGVHLHVCMYVCVRTCVYVCVFACVCACVCAHLRVRMCVCVRLGRQGDDRSLVAPGV